VEVRAPHLRRDQEALRLPSEEKHRGVGRAPAVEQVQVGEQLLGRGAFGQRERSCLPCPGNEPGHAVGVQVSDRCVPARRGVERPHADQLAVLEVLHEGGVEPGDQLRDRGEAAADELCAGLLDQDLHPRMTLRLTMALDEDEPRLAHCGRAVELALRRRGLLRVSGAVFAAEQADVHRAAIDLGEVDLVRTAISGRQVLEEEHREETAQQCVALDEVPDRTFLLGELRLDAADEDHILQRERSRSTSSTRPQMKFAIQLSWPCSISLRFDGDAAQPRLVGQRALESSCWTGPPKRW